MDELLTWEDVANRLRPMARGAQSGLAKYLGIDPSYFSRILKSRTELTVSEAKKVEAWMDNPTAESATSTSPREPSPDFALDSRQRLKVFGYAATSDGDRIAIASDRVLDMLELPGGMNLDPEEYFVILPIGSSMEPRIFAGEAQIVRRNYPPGRDKKVLIEFSDGTAVIKSYKGQRDGRVFAEQYNPPKVLDYDAASVKALHAITMGL